MVPFGSRAETVEIRYTSTNAWRALHINASRNQMREGFLNMISNARDAMPESGTLTFRSGHKEKNRLLISV
ncbi:MAG: hypothetical protein K9J79_06590 [Desulfobacteraceae bacterium]|nr:hypothetical protein [Desulfobacteraceae bacterium]